jgi:hypothetical protein
MKVEVKKMDTISVPLSSELAGRLLPLKDRLPEIIELGLRYLPEQTPPSPREQAEKLWEAAGLLVAREPGATYSAAPASRQRTPIQAGGKPASEIIIEQRGAKTMTTLQDLITELHTLDRELAHYEEKYGLLSETFLAWYQSGEEPDDPAWVQDFALWAGAYQLRLRRQEKYRRLVTESLARHTTPGRARPTLPVGAPA